MAFDLSSVIRQTLVDPSVNVRLSSVVRQMLVDKAVIITTIVTGVEQETLLATSGIESMGIVNEALMIANGINSNGVVSQVLASTTPLPTNFPGVVRSVLCEVKLPTGPIPVFPTLPAGFPVKVSPVLDTTIGTTKSLREMRVAQQTVPLWDIEILFEELRDQTQNSTPYAPFSGFTEYTQLVQQWLMMFGQTNVFAFDASWDNSRNFQSIGTGDGSTFVFTIPRTWGTGALAFNEPIGMLNQNLGLYVNGVLVPTTNYFIDRNKIIFMDANNFIYPPGIGLPINMTFSFYYLCRFVEDEQDFEEFAKNRWTVPSLKFQAVNWP